MQEHWKKGVSFGNMKQANIRSMFCLLLLFMLNPHCSSLWSNSSGLNDMCFETWRRRSCCPAAMVTSGGCIEVPLLGQTAPWRGRFTFLNISWMLILNNVRRKYILCCYLYTICCKFDQKYCANLSLRQQDGQLFLIGSVTELEWSLLMHVITVSPCLTAWTKQKLEIFFHCKHLFHPPDPVSYYNPLHVAVLRNRPNMVRLLVSHGADVEKRDRVR